MNASGEVGKQVRFRAGDRCEYCRMHQSLQGATFHVEHVIPRSRDGQTRLDNLAWACPGCNLRKSDRVEIVDPESGELVPFFDPREHAWDHHFRWRGYEVAGLTPIGRATVDALELNHPRRILIRQAEETLGLFLP